MTLYLLRTPAIEQHGDPGPLQCPTGQPASNLCPSESRQQLPGHVGPPDGAAVHLQDERDHESSLHHTSATDWPRGGKRI